MSNGGGGESGGRESGGRGEELIGSKFESGGGEEYNGKVELFLRLDDI
jgi:hypothetical protein